MNNINELNDEELSKVVGGVNYIRQPKNAPGVIKIYGDDGSKIEFDSENDFRDWCEHLGERGDTITIEDFYGKNIILK